jgi:hypothetical protein
MSNACQHQIADMKMRNNSRLFHPVRFRNRNFITRNVINKEPLDVGLQGDDGMC